MFLHTTKLIDNFRTIALLSQAGQSFQRNSPHVATTFLCGDIDKFVKTVPWLLRCCVAFSLVKRVASLWRGDVKLRCERSLECLRERLPARRFRKLSNFRRSYLVEKSTCERATNSILPDTSRSTRLRWFRVPLSRHVFRCVITRYLMAKCRDVRRYRTRQSQAFIASNAKQEIPRVLFRNNTRVIRSDIVQCQAPRDELALARCTVASVRSRIDRV